MDYFGEIPAMSKEEITAIVASARVAQQQWKTSSFQTRKLLMRTMQRYITENKENCGKPICQSFLRCFKLLDILIARVAVRESGKTLLDALIGEVLVTCEKLAWVLA